VLLLLAYNYSKLVKDQQVSSILFFFSEKYKYAFFFNTIGTNDDCFRLYFNCHLTFINIEYEQLIIIICLELL